MRGGVLHPYRARPRGDHALGERTAAHQLESDPSYRATVEAITATRFLRRPQVVETLEAGEGWLNERVARELLDAERRSPAGDL